MKAQGLTAKPPFEADDVVVLHRPSDRYRRHQRLGGLALPDTAKGIVYRPNQTRQFTDRDNCSVSHKLRTMRALR